MGSSKKHKSRDSKKKKHRSRSHSPEKVKEKHRHHKKHHKDRKKDKSSKDKNGEVYIEKSTLKRESSVEDITVPPPPKISLRPRTPSPPIISGIETSRSDNSLSIEVTNKLRARLGLKPLKVEDGPSASKKSSPDGTSGDQTNETKLVEGGVDMGEFVHKPAENISSKVKSEKIKQKLQDRREKRNIEAKLSKMKKLADDDEGDEDTLEWIKKTRKLQEEKEKAQKRAQMLEELDAEFGVGDLVDSEFRNDRREVYSSKDLKGMRVEHSAEAISEGKTVVLTLKDKGVLDEDDDVLVNVNLLDEEKYKKNIDRKKQKPHLYGYNVYDEPELDEFGNVKKSVLSKYDEEIEGEEKKSFEIGAEDPEEYQKKEINRIREKLQKKTLESLNLPALKLASEYYTEEEMEKFKKPKKKVRKVRQKPLRASDLLPLPSTSQESDIGSRMGASKRAYSEDNDQPMEEESSSLGAVKVKKEPVDESEIMDVDDLLPPPEDLSDVKLEPDDSEMELQLALNKARKIKQMEALENKSSVEKVAAEIIAKKELEDHSSGAQGSIVLNATAEFCRTLGDIPTYGLAGNRDEDAEELMDFEREMNEERRRVEEETQKGAWAEVEIDEGPAEVAPAEVPILDVEPDVGSGVAGALRLAVSKGYLERENKSRPSASRMHHLQAQNYSIEDKTYFDDDKFGRRERYCGPTSDFKEKDGFKPNVKLDYIDDDGRVLSAKEAFRYLSHKFHGKGPGKNKVEKRMKKVEQEVLMKQMSSTDTPLGTLNLLQHKQKETQSPYIVLSGSKHLQSTSISKSKV
ncbi:U4/U6.U5 tri-snRNP-associated protein 1 [Hetaerina americana]|uniref:U4/U6.U5 tri-snRNP-associated protein 1 n=1 Tax=Hetaerina americana TaxID=62018 RepID=UPI003A7F1EDA